MRPGANNTVTLRLREISQLFSRTDSSPLVEREVDVAAAEFIVGCCRGKPSGRDLELAIHLARSSAGEDFEDVGGALRSYFASRAEMKRVELAQLMRRGRLSLCAGSVFLAICLLLGGLVAGLGSNAAFGIVREGLTICGWVAMWKPLEIYLYDWWPLFEEKRRLDCLARMRVRFAPSGSQTAFPGNSYGGNEIAAHVAA